MDYDPFKAKRWETIAEMAFDEQIVFLSSASLPDFIRGVCEVLHEAPFDEVKTGAYREALLPSYRDRSGNTVSETLRAQVTDAGFLELTSYCSVKTPVHLELEAAWIALKQQVKESANLPTWESRRAGDNAEVFTEEIDPSEQGQLEFRAKFIKALTWREVQKNKVGIETIRIVDGYL